MGNAIIREFLPNHAASTIGCEDHNWSDGGLQRLVEIGEGLQVEHVYLVDEKDARNELGYSLVNVLVYHLVDLHA